MLVMKLDYLGGQLVSNRIFRLTRTSSDTDSLADCFTLFPWYESVTNYDYHYCPADASELLLLFSLAGHFSIIYYTTTLLKECIMISSLSVWGFAIWASCK